MSGWESVTAPKRGRAGQREERGRRGDGGVTKETRWGGAGKICRGRSSGTADGACSAEALVGSRGRSEAIKADLIVMGSHRPELRDYLLGPNAARVVRHAPCSVVVVRS